MTFRRRLLLDSRVVDLPMTYDLTFDMLLSLKPLFFNSLKISHDSQTTLKHKTLESNKSVIVTGSREEPLAKFRSDTAGGPVGSRRGHVWRWIRPLPTEVVRPE